MTAILIVEPDPMVRRILTDKLRREGYDVTATRALPAEVAAYDVALLDGTAPPEAPRCGWLAICDGTNDAEALAAVRAGAAGVVRKPFKPTVVAEQIRLLLSLVAP